MKKKKKFHEKELKFLAGEEGGGGWRGGRKFEEEKNVKICREKIKKSKTFLNDKINLRLSADQK